jgi:hypothetical protein
VLLDFALSKLGHPTFIPYYLIIVLPAFLLLAAVGLVRLPGRATGIIVLGLLAVVSGVRISNWYKQPSLENYRDATRYILGHEGPGDGIISYPSLTLAGFVYYEALARSNGPTVVPFQLGHPLAMHPPRIWLLRRTADPAVTPRAATQVAQSLTGTYERVGVQRFGGVAATLYRAR